MTTALCGNMLVEIKHEKLGDKLHTDTSSYVKICNLLGHYVNSGNIEKDL